jgi:hypothetical protein
MAEVRIGFVTADVDRVLEQETDRAVVTAAFAAAGASLEYLAWDRLDTDWEAFDLVVVRSPWDYPERLDGFLSWLDAAGSSLGLRLHNPAGVIRWNLDKRYLGELADAGVPVVPTVYAATAEEAAEAIASVSLPGTGERGAPGAGTGAGADADADADEVVVKPTISAGSRDTGRFARTDPAALALAERIVAAGRVAMVQPAVPSVAERGEVALVLIDGQLAHAYRKGPILASGGAMLGGELREVLEPVVPDPAWVALAEQVHAASVARAQALGALGERERSLLYARIDLVELPDGSPALLEAELFEPFLAFDLAPEAADRFAAACVARAAGV